MTHIVVQYAERIESEANGREHWRPKSARVKRHRITAWAELRKVERPAFLGPVQITLTRIAPRTLDDDNLAAGFKATRDGVADWLGVDDGDKAAEGVVDAYMAPFLGPECKKDASVFRKASPLEYVTKNCCPLLVFHGTADVVVPVIHSEMFDERWKTKEGAQGPHWGLYTGGPNPQPKFAFEG